MTPVFNLNCRIRGLAWKVVVRALVVDLIIVTPLLLSYSLFLGPINKSYSLQGSIDGRFFKGI